MGHRHRLIWLMLGVMWSSILLLGVGGCGASQTLKQYESKLSLHLDGLFRNTPMEYQFVEGKPGFQNDGVVEYNFTIKLTSREHMEFVWGDFSKSLRPNEVYLITGRVLLSKENLSNQDVNFDQLFFTAVKDK